MSPTRRWDGEPETEADARFFDLRQSGYEGPIDQDGYAVEQARSWRPGAPLLLLALLVFAAIFAALATRG